MKYIFISIDTQKNYYCPDVVLFIPNPEEMKIYYPTKAVKMMHTKAHCQCGMEQETCKKYWGATMS